MRVLAFLVLAALLAWIGVSVRLTISRMDALDARVERLRADSEWSGTLLRATRGAVRDVETGIESVVDDRVASATARVAETEVALRSALDRAIEDADARDAARHATTVQAISDGVAGLQEWVNRRLLRLESSVDELRSAAAAARFRETIEGR